MNERKVEYELISEIAKRASQLATTNIKKLRLLHPDNVDGTYSGSQWKGVSKSEIIEAILESEFQES